MAINPDNITTIRVDQLADDTLGLTDKFPHTVGTELKSSTIQELVDLVAAAVGVGSGVGYLPISVTDGQQLPDVPTDPSFFLAGAGTYLNINGFPNLICTENLNAIMSLADHWEIAVEIPINPLSGTVQSVTGTAVDNTDPLNPIINLGGSTPTLQEVTDEGNVVEYGAESTFAKYRTSADAFAEIRSNDDGYLELEIQDASGEKTRFFNGGFIKSSGGNDYNSAFPNILNSVLGVLPQDKTASFTAEIGVQYNTNGTITVTDAPTQTNRGYIVHVIGGTSTIGGVGYTSGALVYRYYDGSSWISTNMNNAITIDATPTDGSSNAVSSNGVFDALATKVSKSDYTPAHSILVQQSGTGTPTALSVGNNTLVGRLSGGGSGIDDLSTSDVRTLLSINNVDNTSDLNKPISTATQTALDLKQDKSRYLYQGYTTVTGVVVPIIAISLLIPANTYSATDGFEIIVNINKTTTATAVNYNLYHDTTINGTTNAIATGVSLATTNRGSAIQRILNLNGGNAYNNLAAASLSLTTFLTASASPTITTFNPAIDQYITLQISGLTVLTETSNVTMSIRPLKG